jgi:hypothetical protein
MKLPISQKRNPKSEGIPKDEVRENHPDTLESENDLAVLYIEQDRFEKAEPLLLRNGIGGAEPFKLLYLWHRLMIYYYWIRWGVFKANWNKK